MVFDVEATDDPKIYVGGEKSALMAVVATEDGFWRLIINRRADALCPELKKRRFAVEVIKDDLTDWNFAERAFKFAKSRARGFSPKMKVVPLDSLETWELGYLRNLSDVQLSRVLDALLGFYRHCLVRKRYALAQLRWASQHLMVHAVKGHASIVSLRPNRRKWLRFEWEGFSNLFAAIEEAASGHSGILALDDEIAEFVEQAILPEMADPLVTRRQMASCDQAAAAAPIECLGGSFEDLERMAGWVLTLLERRLPEDAPATSLSIVIEAGFAPKAGGKRSAQWTVSNTVTHALIHEHYDFKIILDAILFGLKPSGDGVPTYSGARMSESGERPPFRWIERMSGAGAAHDDLEAASGLKDFLSELGWPDWRIQEAVGI